MSAVDLTEQEWGQVLNLLSEAPWKVANPLLMKIGQQLRENHLAMTDPPNLASQDANGKEARHE
jgi:hypothetical protein